MTSKDFQIAVLALAATLPVGAIASAQTAATTPPAANNSVNPSVLLPGVSSSAAAGAGGATPLPLPPSLTGNNLYGELPAAAAAKAGAQARLENLRDEITDFVRIQRMVFDNSAPYVSAVAERVAAYNEFAAARKQVIDGLRVSDEYEALLKLREDTSRKIEIERDRVKPRKEELDGLLTLRLSLGHKLADMESAALGQSSDLQDKRKSLMAAADKVDGLRRDFELRLRAGNELALARRTVREAREMQAMTIAYYAQATRTADVLLNYAYYTQYLNYRRPLVVGSPILPYSYPYGGYGYGGVGGVTGAPGGVTGAPGGVVAPGGVTGGGAGFGYVPYQ